MKHPITPPPELVRQWETTLECPDLPSQKALYIATQAARWGADQELEACTEWIYQHFQCGLQWGKDLLAARRPKPPSLKQQALEALDSASYQPGSDFKQIDSARSATIRRALESLPDPQD